ncbi:MAG: CPBP family intramembrane metalloprotease [Anaerolineae bacterium]|nr:CPBP family intramembrane metalloprotease [Anaerolineae bacterium]
MILTANKANKINLFVRYLEVAGFVAIWMALGWLLRLDSDAYLLLGVPLLLLFQLVVRHRPVRQLWVRDPEQPLRFDWVAAVLSLVLMAVPAYLLFAFALPQRLWVDAGWALCALVGGGIAGWVLRNQRADALKRGLPSFIVAVLIGWALFIVAALLSGRSPMVALDRMPSVLIDLLKYFAVTFVLEEVAFRGALDSHIYPPSEKSTRIHAWVSAIFVSAVWGLWHWPIEALEPGQTVVELVALLLIVHTAIGVPSSFSWRQSGTLVLPALAHALIDAYSERRHVLEHD